MPDLVRVERMLASVTDKIGLADFAKALQKKFAVKVISTGGTAKEMRGAGCRVQDVSEYTGFPEIMDGRVKTLHPVVHGGLLGEWSHQGHCIQAGENGIRPIQMLVVNFYAFQKVVDAYFEKDREASEVRPIIEAIDIGGPAMVRSAAKNFEHTAVITSPEQYSLVELEMNHFAGCTSFRLRRMLARQAFELVYLYDKTIHEWFSSWFHTLRDPA